LTKKLLSTGPADWLFANIFSFLLCPLISDVLDIVKNWSRFTLSLFVIILYVSMRIQRSLWYSIFHILYLVMVWSVWRFATPDYDKMTKSPLVAYSFNFYSVN